MCLSKSTKMAHHNLLTNDTYHIRKKEKIELMTNEVIGNLSFLPSATSDAIRLESIRSAPDQSTCPVRLPTFPLQNHHRDLSFANRMQSQITGTPQTALYRICRPLRRRIRGRMLDLSDLLGYEMRWLALS